MSILGSARSDGFEGFEDAGVGGERCSRSLWMPYSSREKMLRGFG